MAQIEVVGGTYVPHPRARFRRATFVLYTAHQGGKLREVRYPPVELKNFQVCSGLWERELADVADWTRALTAASLMGAPAAGAVLVFREFVVGQRALVTWLNAVLGGAAATAALKSRRTVRFRAWFKDGGTLEGKTSERELTLRLPLLLRGALNSR